MLSLYTPTRSTSAEMQRGNGMERQGGQQEGSGDIHADIARGQGLCAKFGFELVDTYAVGFFDEADQPATRSPPWLSLSGQHVPHQVRAAIAGLP